MSDALRAQLELKLHEAMMRVEQARNEANYYAGLLRRPALGKAEQKEAEERCAVLANSEPAASRPEVATVPPNIRSALAFHVHDAWHHTKPSERKDIVRFTIDWLERALFLKLAGSGAGNRERANDSQPDATVPPTPPPDAETVPNAPGEDRADSDLLCVRCGMPIDGQPMYVRGGAPAHPSTLACIKLLRFSLSISRASAEAALTELAALRQQLGEQEQWKQEIINAARDRNPEGATALDFYAVWLDRERAKNAKLSSDLQSLRSGWVEGVVEAGCHSIMCECDRLRVVPVPNDWPLDARVQVREVRPKAAEQAVAAATTGGER